MNMFETALTKTLQIDYPIIQAPMAGGITTSELVATASESGGLGMIGAGYLASEDLAQLITSIKTKTNKPFGVNLFVPSNIQHDLMALQKAKELLQAYYHTYDIDDSAIQIPNNEIQWQTYEQQINIILEANVPVVSFTFGIPEKKVIQQLKKRGITLIGTAETVDEALLLEQSGLDMIVMQGSEAGGHRGGFNEQSTNQQIGLMALLPQAVDAVSVPIIAAGGIMDGRGLIAAYTLGAAGIQMGTAFLLTNESGADTLHKEAIITSKENSPVMTSAFSGKQARGINNDFIRNIKAHEHQLPAYPVMNNLTQPIRKAAKKDKNQEHMSLWSGQNIRNSKNQSAAHLIETTMKEAKKIINQIRKEQSL